MSWQGQYNQPYWDPGPPDTYSMSGGFQGPSCSNCGGTDHVSSYCREPGFQGPSCSNCGGTDHASSYCREPQYNQGYEENYNYGCYDEGYGSYQSNGWRNEPWQAQGPYPEEDDLQHGFDHNPYEFEHQLQQQYAPPQQQDQVMQIILDTLHQIQSEIKEQKAYQEMLETQTAQLAEDNRIEFGSGKTYDEPEYEIEDEIIEPMVERECLVDVVDEDHSGLGRVNDGPRDPILEVEHVSLEDEELEVEAISVDDSDHHLDKIDMGVIEEGEGKMEESPMPPPEVKFSIKTLPPFPICAYFEETRPKPVVVTLTFSLEPGDPTKGMSPSTHKYYTIFEDGDAISFGLLENLNPNLWNMVKKKIQEAMVFKEGIFTIKGEAKGLGWELIRGRFDPRPPD